MENKKKSNLIFIKDFSLRIEEKYPKALELFKIKN